MARKPVKLFVFYHDDVDTGTRRIVPRNYLQSCVIELEKVCDREFVIEYLSSVPGMTDIDYKGGEEIVLKDWIRRVRAFAGQRGLSLDRTHRYLLVTGDKLSESILGVTYAGHYAVIASLYSYQVIAHELGHSFGATHEDAELQYNAFGLVCETYVFPDRQVSRANCYQYSLKNRQNIAAFLGAVD
ncbi:hypothetical protein M2401_001351 [Pseudomonas sp. JUb42]|uniref:zinc-dependent metalloprotease n=1 Tax=Pseudomonas sp. JUb42 TaxID=2940611 RepID=UPI00216A8AE4|nr:zinc-dependent metalloprotease [Pseudomonas sp. JUb42]MCS3467626.1 hypothetical protein [Pseudomonas sp. JUb42]